jgi:hypothetical protein
MTFIFVSVPLTIIFVNAMLTIKVGDYMNKRCYRCSFACRGKDAWYGLHSSCFTKWFNLTAPEQFQDIISRYQPEEYLIGGTKNGTFFHGMFRKYASVLGGVKYILKIGEQEYPELPAMEYLCNQLYKALGIDVPPFYLLLLEGQQSCFVTENFMGRLYESSLVHLYHFLAQETPYTCEHIVQIIGEKTGSVAAQESFVLVTLVDCLVGNNDRHGRNLAFIKSTQGYRLAPFYDNVSCLGIELASLLEADHQPKGAIGTLSSDTPTMKDYVKEWYRLGFGYVIERLRAMIARVNIHALIKNGHVTPKRKKALLRIINQRVDELCQ